MTRGFRELFIQALCQMVNLAYSFLKGFRTIWRPPPSLDRKMDGPCAKPNRNCRNYPNQLAGGAQTTYTVAEEMQAAFRAQVYNHEDHGPTRETIDPACRARGVSRIYIGGGFSPPFSFFWRGGRFGVAEARSFTFSSSTSACTTRSTTSITVFNSSTVG
jgi:hypothetical protein